MVAALVACCSLWGASFLFGKIVLEAWPPSHLVLGRFTLALVVLLPAALRRGLPPRETWPALVGTGVLGVPGVFLLQFGGLALTTATSASLLVGAFAPVLAVLAAWRYGERLGASGWAAVALSAVGAACMVGFPGPGRSLLGDALVLASVITSAVWALETKGLLRRLDALRATAFAFTAGTLALVPMALWWDGVPDLALDGRTWAALLALGVGCTGATFLLWNWAVAQTDASRAGVFVNIEPLVGALLGILVLGERPTLGTLAGGALVIGAAVLVSWGARTVRRPGGKAGALAA